MKEYKSIIKEIKRHDKIVIARHIGPDPDALGSQIGLKEIIQKNFKNKQVLAVGTPAPKFKYLGTLDQIKENEDFKDALLITLDVPDIARIDGVSINDFKTLIKIDHHPKIDIYADIECVDETASSTSQMIIEFALLNKLTIPGSAAEKLFIGLITDTNRFMYSYTTPKTFRLVSELIKITNIDFTKLYETLYMRDYKDLKFESYIASNLTITEQNVAHIYIADKKLKEYKMDPASAGNLIGNLNYINEYLVWVIFTEDKQNKNIRGSIRSRGPIINEVATHFSGGGHIFASGVRLKKEEEIELLITELNEVTKEYKES